jgi:hypothetical protein
MDRSFGGFAGSERAAPPAQLEIKDDAASGPGLLMDGYYFRVIGLTGRMYVKEVRYGGENVTFAPLRVGSAPAGTSLHVAAGHDGGVLRVQVAGPDGTFVPHATVMVLPGSAVSDAELAGRLVTGQADQHGEYVSGALMPGKYLVLATSSPVAVQNPEFLAKVRAVRSQAREVEVPPNGTVALKVETTN